MEIFSTEIYILLFCTACLAGLIDAIAGGGGLLTVPVLFSVGLPPLSVLATNKFQSTIGTFTSSLQFFRKGHIDLKHYKWHALISFLGAALGSLTVHYIDVSLLSQYIPILIILVAIYFLFFPYIKRLHKSWYINPSLFIVLFCLPISLYDGVLGPGTGSFFVISFMFFSQMTVLKATAVTKLCNFATNLGSLCIFVLYGKIIWSLGLAMCCGQLCGAYLGAHIAMKNGERVIRPLLVIISIIMSIYLLLKN